MSSTRGSDFELEDIPDVDITLLTLRKPTALKKVIDAVPIPASAVPKNGLPIWYKLGLECKLPVPKMPEGKIVFSRGKVGEDVWRIGLGKDSAQPGFDLTDPYCNNVSYDYVAMHDPHLAHHFAQKPARNRMKGLGLVTKDGRAVCSLKEFNQYRKFLYNHFMDKIHEEIKKIDERARDDLVLKRVNKDVSRRHATFKRAERTREHLEKAAREQNDEIAMKKRLAKEQEKKVQARMKYLTEYNEKVRKERASRAREKEARIKQRIQAAMEMELRRKITMVRQWKKNEAKRLARIKAHRDAVQKLKEEEAAEKWEQRVREQNMKIREKEMLLKLYVEDMVAAARRRTKKAEIYAYNVDLELQHLKLQNLKLMRGGEKKAAELVRKMGIEFEKSKRGAKGMSLEMAKKLAKDAMRAAISTEADTFVALGQARVTMDKATILPGPPLKLLEEVLEAVIMEFARRRISRVLHTVSDLIYAKAEVIFFQNIRPPKPKPLTDACICCVKHQQSRFIQRVTQDVAEDIVKKTSGPREKISFGEVTYIQNEETTDLEMKSIRTRPPTPVPSKTLLAEVTFVDKIDDLPDPIADPHYLPERKKIIEMTNTLAKLLTKQVSARVDRGMDIILGHVTLPNLRHKMEWGEIVESLAGLLAKSTVHADTADVRRASDFLAHRILRDLNSRMKIEKEEMKRKMRDDIKRAEVKDFYNPNAIEAPIEDDVPIPPDPVTPATPATQA